MRVSTILGLAVLAALFGSSPVRADTVAWRSLGRLPGALKIAACSDRQLYYVGNDGWLWVNRSGGADRAWQRLSRLSVRVEAISCAAGRLHVLSPDKTLYRNDGDDAHPRWKSLGRLTWASQVAAATRGVGAVLYALGDDGGLLVSDKSWRELGETLPRARRISAASLRDVFGLDADGRLHVNHGRGLGPYWLNLDAPSGTIEIASANARRLYALAQDGSLWEGSVERVVRSLTRDADFETWVRGVLGGIQIRIREGCERRGYPEELRGHLGEERLPRPGYVCSVRLEIRFADELQRYGLRDIDITGPRITDRLHLSAFSSLRKTAALLQDTLELFAAFERARLTVNTPVGWLGFDVVDIGLTGELVLTKDAWDDVTFSLANFRFDGQLRGTDIPSTQVAIMHTAYGDFKGDMERLFGPQLRDLLASADVQAAIRQILLQYANFDTHETWHGIVYGGIGIGDGALVLLVER